MGIPVLIWRWVADKERAHSVNHSPRRWKLKNRGGPPCTSVLLLLPFRPSVPGPAHVWFTSLRLDWGNRTVRYLVSGYPLNRCLCLIYESSSVQLHSWSFFHAGWACLWMPVLDQVGWGWGKGVFPGLMPGTKKKAGGRYTVLFQLESLFNYMHYACINQSKT